MNPSLSKKNLRVLIKFINLISVYIRYKYNISPSLSFFYFSVIRLISGRRTLLFFFVGIHDKVVLS